jgi:hypothetical protein
MRRNGLVTGFALVFLVGGGVAMAEGFKNLQVLSKTISKEELKAQMKGQAKSLGVECDFCHEVPDMASDKNEKKAIARKMIAMTAELNEKYIRPLKDGSKHLVTCGTCHQGKESPPPFVPPAGEKDKK